jgi:glycosyltransferase involved in cell wall biosynthesis
VNGAVIAALNEERTIGRLVTQLKTQGLQVCVIDDGSTDSTGRIAKEAGAVVIRHPQPLGIGKSLMDGWRYSLDQAWHYTVQIDAGGSHNPQEWQKGFDSNTDIMIGSRFRKQSEYIGRRWRAIASRITAHALNFATKQKITDWTSGYRVFSRKALEVLIDYQYMTNMHTWQIEVIGEAVHKGLSVAEFPITYRAGDSSMKWQTVDDLIKVYLWILNR